MSFHGKKTGQGLRWRRHATISCTVAMLLLTLYAAGLASAQKMPLEPWGSTVIGLYNTGGAVGGLPGTSRISNPASICFSYGTQTTSEPGTLTSLDSLAVGALGYVRSFNRSTNMSGTFFGTGRGSVNVGGTFAEAQVSQPYACVRYGQTTTSGTVYYVTSDAYVYWMQDNVVSMFLVDQRTQGAAAFVGLAVYGDFLYLIGQLTFEVHRCTLRASTPQPVDCQTFTLQRLPQVKVNQVGLAVNARALFITTTTGLYAYDLGTRQLLASTVTIPFVDVQYNAAEDVLYAMSRFALYQVTLSTTNQLTTELIAGTEKSVSTPCLTSADNQDGQYPLLCNPYKLHAVSSDSMYITLMGFQVVRRIAFPPVGVPLNFFRRPFPVGMTGADATMTLLISELNPVLQAATGSSRAAVDEAAIVINSTWWSTEALVRVPQRDYDLTTTTPAIRTASYSTVLQSLEVYYNRTDEVVYSDPNFLPTCDVEAMHAIEQAIAARARDVLQYPIIYTDPAKTVTIGGNPNITLVKLLMPAVFNNATTQNLLQTVANFSHYILEAMHTALPDNRTATITFSNEEFPFEQLNAAGQQEARFLIQQMVTERLAWCARSLNPPQDAGPTINDTAPSNGSVDGGQTTGLVPFCTSRVGVTNATVSQQWGQTGTVSSFQIFVPNGFEYTFAASKCVDGMDWEKLQWWMTNHTVIVIHKKCGTGCIVGIAVASAVVAALLMVLLVVWTSKRKRLAGAVVPATVVPKFQSSLDSEEETNGTTNNAADRSRNPNPLNVV